MHKHTLNPEKWDWGFQISVPDICAVDEISVCWPGLQRQLAEWKGSLDTVSPPQRGLSFYLLHFPALFFLLKSPSIVHFSLKKCSYKMSYFHSGLNNATVEKKFYMLSFVKFNFSVKWKEFLFRLLSGRRRFSFRKKFSLCVGKVPTDHFFNKIADVKITLLFNEIKGSAFCLCLRNNIYVYRQTPDMESDVEHSMGMKMGL